MDDLPSDVPAPRLCHLVKWADFEGYGFNLHAERSNPGQFVGKIDPDSPAQLAGLREGDRIVEVNGVNVNNENHLQVVERIKAHPNETRLLVVDAQAEAWYREHDLVVKSSQSNVTYMKTPTPRTHSDSPHTHFSDTESSGAASPSGLPPATSVPSITIQTNESDSLEEQTHSAAITKPASPPMSPDSGKGDEERDTLTIEAEINRRQPGADDELQPDSLSASGASTSLLNDGDQSKAEMIGGSGCKVDTGKEIDSSPDTSSSSGNDSESGDSMAADSLSGSAEFRSAHQMVKRELEKTFSQKPAPPSGAPMNEPKPQVTPTTIKHVNEANNDADSVTSKAPKATIMKTNTTPLQGKEESKLASGNKTSEVKESMENNKTLDDSLNIKTQQQQQQRLTGINNNNSIEERKKVNATSNNNYNGLNLNMTASEMRELLARRKKFDPKKAQMNIRQKYEIIQQM